MALLGVGSVTVRRARKFRVDSIGQKRFLTIPRPFRYHFWSDNVKKNVNMKKTFFLIIFWPSGTSRLDAEKNLRRLVWFMLIFDNSRPMSWSVDFFITLDPYVLIVNPEYYIILGSLNKQKSVNEKTPADIKHKNRCEGDRCSEAVHENRNHG